LAILFMAIDFSRLASFSTAAQGAARAGLLYAPAQGKANAAGTTIDTRILAAASEIPNNSTTWGTAFLGGAADCGSGHTCGDATGSACAPASTFWTAVSPHPTACYAVGYCTVATAGATTTCTSYTWGSLPAATSGKGVVVVVAYKVSPIAPFSASFATAGAFYITASVYSYAQY
jgi:hypothetical protein